MTAGIRQYSGNIMWITGLLERENRICEKAIGGRLDYCSERLFTPSWQNVFPAPLTLVLATWTVCQFLSWDLQKSAKFLPALWSVYFSPPWEVHALELWFLKILSWAKTCGINLSPTQGWGSGLTSPAEPSQDQLTCSQTMDLGAALL